MLHGFTQNGRCLGPMAEEIARERRVVLPDLPGHGEASSSSGFSVAESADDLLDRCVAPAGRPHVFGYSMGGRVALRLALDHPRAVRSLVVLGATAGIRDAADRRDRARLDEERARRVESLGVAEFCREWLDAPMFSGLPDWARFTEERASNTVEGLAGSLRNAGTGSMEPVWDRLGSIEVEVLLLAGADDTGFVELAHEMAGAIGSNARVRTIAGAGHAAHLEQPHRTARVLAEFLTSVEES